MKSRIVVAAIVEKGEEILLGQKKTNTGPYPNQWHTPGGGVKLGEETLLEAISREIKEETGLTVTNMRSVSFDEDHEPDKHGEMTHYIFLNYVCTYESGELQAEDDLDVLQWVHKSQLAELDLNKPLRKQLMEMGYLA